MIKYKVGDRVKVIGRLGAPQAAMIGRIGTVVRRQTIFNSTQYFVLIDEFDNPHSDDRAILFNGVDLTPFLKDTEKTDAMARLRYYNYVGSDNTVPKIKNVIYNRPATIIFWKDGTKTVVKCKGEEFDPEKGLAMAIAKKALGNNYHYYDIFEKWLPNPKAGRGVMKKCDTCEHFDLSAGYDATCDACFDKHVRDHNIISV